MRKTIMFLCTFLFVQLSAQVAISGSVFDLDGIPLEGASVYINNTSKGTTTNEKGVFYLDVPRGQFDLVVSYIGFTSERSLINTNSNIEPLVFKLVPKSNVLDEIIIERRKKMSIDRKMFYLRRFRAEFLGTSQLAQRCKILNEDVLKFDVDPVTQKLSVSASEPLKISNPILGYTIHYDLLLFELTDVNVYFYGNVKYEEREAKERKKKRWRKNRQKAYNGSLMHFLQSVINQNVRDQGFIVDKVRRIKNSKRPSDEQIREAEFVLRNRGGLQRDPFENNRKNDRDVSRARIVIENAKLNEFTEEFIKRNLVSFEYTQIKDSQYSLQFTDFLRVTYRGEFPDENYKQKDDFTYQVSLITLNRERAEIRKTGVLKNPLDVFLLGYWGFEKVGDTLPLDYTP